MAQRSSLVGSHTREYAGLFRFKVALVALPAPTLSVATNWVNPTHSLTPTGCASLRAYSGPDTSPDPSSIALPHSHRTARGVRPMPTLPALGLPFDATRMPARHSSFPLGPPQMRGLRGPCLEN